MNCKKYQVQLTVMLFVFSADRHDADAAGVRPRLRSAIAGPGPLLTLYLDTSLLVAALTNETETGRMQAWLGEQEPSRLAVSEWVITEFSAALSMTEGTDRGQPPCRCARHVHSTEHRQLFCRYRACNSARQLGSPGSMRWACAPATPCISPSAPITVRRSAR